MTTTADFEALAEELKQLRADLGKVAAATETLVSNAGKNARAYGQEGWKNAKETVERQIEEQPVASAAIALAIGVALGLIVSRR